MISFIPQSGPGLPQPPYPAVILTHGFARDKKFHRKNARYMAERGILVLTPNMSSLLGGERAQIKNMENTVDHIKWLITRSENPGDVLYGLIDPNAMGLAGHSAGGAVSFEAAIRAQTSGYPVAALCLLDAVPGAGHRFGFRSSSTGIWFFAVGTVPLQQQWKRADLLKALDFSRHRCAHRKRHPCGPGKPHRSPGCAFLRRHQSGQAGDLSASHVPVFSGCLSNGVG